MGVTGLWRLIDPAGKPVPVETLENKVLAVDISIWLHQMVKGYQDAKGAPLPNAHLMGLFQRLCKLLYFRIKPIFVFDGGFPDLKKETIAKRQDSKIKYNSESERLKRELSLILSKKTAVSSLLGKQISPKKGSSSAIANNDDDIFKLPALPEKEETESESEEESNSSGSIIDLHTIDLGSENFKSLPSKDKYDLLLELRETRKMNSWGKLHELPKKSDNFSDFQMERLLKRRKVQECLEETEKEMGDIGMSFNDLESLLNEEGIDTKIDSLPTRRIASNNNTRFLLINNVKQALADARKKKEAESQPSTSKIEEEGTEEDNIKPLKRDELEDDLEKAIKMSLECVDDADTSAYTSKTDDSWTSVLTDTDSEDDDGFAEPDLTSAKAYIMQYSDFTHKTIDNIVVSTKNNGNKAKSKFPKVDQIIDELNKEKSVIVDNIHISSSDDEYIDVSSELHNNNTDKPNQSVIELNTSEDLESSLNNNEDDDVTQASVVCVENPVQDIITLDTSTEENLHTKSTNIEQIDLRSDNESDSEEEFEDVPELESKEIKPVVQLTLIVGEAPEDDIFADVFTDNITDEPENVKDIIIEDAKEKRLPVDVEVKNIEKEISRQDRNMEITEHVINKANDRNIIQSLQVIQDNSSTIEPVSSKLNVCVDKIVIADKSFTKTDVTENPTKTDNEITAKERNKPLSTDILNTMSEELQNEEQDLLREKGRLDRIGRNITEQMTKEAQELLQIFGIPYIVAPMEAEAQCAFLESVKLTDGTITDDSDIWLFGGRTVYKNFFNQKKHVLQYLAERIERSYNLTREQLVLLALLVGSDYTTGVTGVGPVTALEILASFPFNKKQFLNETSKQARYTQIVTGLQEFKKWVRGGKRTDNTTLKKKLKNVDLTDDFPSIRVVQAYLEPNVEKSEEKFSWGELDITVLRDYTKAKFGWSQNKLDEIIKPVLKRVIDRKSQKNMQDYFKRKIDFQPLDDQMSKRVKAAVQRMGPESLEENNGPMAGKVKPVRKRKVKGKDDNEPEDIVTAVAGPSKAEQIKNSEDKVLNDHGVKVVSQIQDGKSSIEIVIPKTDRFQEIIPQREKDKQSLLQNKMKAIEIFRKTKMDRKRKPTKKRVNLPKEKAELSESSHSD